MSDNKLTCLVCGTPVPPDEISQFSQYSGLPSPTCIICCETMNSSIKSQEELVGKSLLRRIEKLKQKEANEL